MNSGKVLCYWADSGTGVAEQQGPCHQPLRVSQLQIRQFPSQRSLLSAFTPSEKAPLNMRANQTCGQTGLVDVDPHFLNESTHAFQHSSLDPDVHGIRLVVIEPSIEREAPVYCKLRYVIFAQKPMSMKLSHTCGAMSRRREALWLMAKNSSLGCSC